MTVYTIGYGNRGYTAFLALLRRYGITHLADVRSTPYSRYFVEFHQEALQRSMAMTEIRYVYLGDALGGRESEPSETGHTAKFHEGIEVLYRALQNPDRRIALMCGCLRAEACHRGRILGEVLSERGVEVLHVDADDGIVSQAILGCRIAPAQLSLFG